MSYRNRLSEKSNGHDGMLQFLSGLADLMERYPGESDWAAENIDKLKAVANRL